MTDTYTQVLPPEFISGNEMPVTRATISRERMGEILHEAIEAYHQQKSQLPETPQAIAGALRNLSERMSTVGSAMTFFVGFDGEMVDHGREMIGAAGIAAQWADKIQEKLEQKE